MLYFTAVLFFVCYLPPNARAH